MNLRFIPSGVFCALMGLAIAGPAAVFAAEIRVPAATDGVLTLDEALARTRRANPELTAAAGELRAAAARVRQAGRLPNPELSVSLENVAGDGNYGGTDAGEWTVALSQPLELGGKRSLRREAAEIQRRLAATDQGRSHADVLATARQRYVNVLAAQERLGLAREQVALAEKSLLVAEERIRAGKSPEIDRLRLRGEADRARLAVEQAERTLGTARQTLAASWNAPAPDFDTVAGELTGLPPQPALTEVEASVAQTPEATGRQLATALSGVELAQARAARIPDPSLTVGWRRFQDDGSNALLLGVSLPLPLFNRGDDEVDVAGSRLHSVQAREQNARNELLRQLRSAWQALADARAEAEVLADRIVPAAAAGFAAAEFGYQAGKFGLLELLDAQRTLFEARLQQLAARADCHLAAVELQRLLGTEAGSPAQQLQTP